MTDRRKKLGLADVTERARAAAGEATDMLHSRNLQHQLVRLISQAALYLMAIQVAMARVAAFDHGQLARQFPHLALTLAVTGVYALAAVCTHLTAAAASVWDPTLLADYFARRPFTRRVRRQLIMVGTTIVVGTSQVAMWLLPIRDQEPLPVRLLTTTAVVVLAARTVVRTVVRLRAAGIGAAIRRQAAVLRPVRTEASPPGTLEGDS
jgi:hypothetical protein